MKFSEDCLGGCYLSDKSSDVYKHFTAPECQSSRNMFVNDTTGTTMWKVGLNTP